MLQKLRARNKKGFTLIELMIVIAIIGILAAIAVPQFLAYRMRSYNTAAKSVVHNLKADNANLNSELGVYGHTETLPVALNAVAGANGVADVTVKAGLITAATPIAPGARLFGTTFDGLRSMAVGVTLGNMMIGQVDDANDANDDSTFHAYARHFKGDTAYAIDMDIENIMLSVSNANVWVNKAGLGATAIVAAIPPADDINNKGGGGLPTVNWTRVR